LIQLPASLGKYELQEFLGGGMSHVYRAFDTVIGRPVAVKILTGEACQNREARDRFLAEARMAGQLTHENVISIYDFGTDEAMGLFMVMEFLQGEDLRNAIRNGHTGAVADKLRIALQIARALDFIHRHKIIHRDIKPENIHINSAGLVKLMDFGIAKHEDLSMTRPGYVLGTAYYMAPEQVRGEALTPQVDVYAFGVVLFELFTGAKPFSGESVNQVFYQILNVPLDLTPIQTSGAPQTLIDLVKRCTDKIAAARPQGFGPVVAELERLIAERTDQTQVMASLSGAVGKPKISPRLMAGVAAAVVGALVGAYFVLRPSLPQRITTPTGVMVLVPGGEFHFGTEKQPISLPAFYIDQTEVTNEAYAKFCEATKRTFTPAEGPAYPVSNVTIAEAREFAAWAGKKLPSEFQWEKAARGNDGLQFPWGATKDPSRANIGSKVLRPANDFPNGASPFGALQMVGNVWEYVDRLRSPGPEALKAFPRLQPPPSADEPWYMIRGQSFAEPLADSVLTESAAVPARWKDRYIGFRCVKDTR
jgi:serine/threonine-protein kinase